VVVKKHIAEIVDILKREVRSFNFILEFLFLEEKSLLECDTAALAELLERQEDVFSSIACLEKSRMDVLAKIAEKTGEDLETYTISRLAELVDNPLKKELIETGHILARLNEESRQKKASNALLINQAKILIESDIRIILSAISRNENHTAVYTPPAESDLLSQSVCLDERM
jgi:hypothetical protein